MKLLFIFKYLKFLLKQSNCGIAGINFFFIIIVDNQLVVFYEIAGLLPVFAGYLRVICNCWFV